MQHAMTSKYNNEGVCGIDVLPQDGLITKVTLINLLDENKAKFVQVKLTNFFP